MSTVGGSPEKSWSNFVRISVNVGGVGEKWNKTDIALRRAQHVVFCGYSFPDADIHIKYLLKRAQTNREVPLKVTVVNNHAGKKPSDSEQEEGRYKRFLGAGVNYTSQSFEDFVANPLGTLHP